MPCRLTRWQDYPVTQQLERILESCKRGGSRPKLACIMHWCHQASSTRTGELVQDLAKADIGNLNMDPLNH
jgi:hypothetical protein